MSRARVISSLFQVRSASLNNNPSFFVSSELEELPVPVKAEEAEEDEGEEELEPAGQSPRPPSPSLLSSAAHLGSFALVSCDHRRRTL